jgi:NADH-quinone oxidoreductase subunit M
LIIILWFGFLYYISIIFIFWLILLFYLNVSNLYNIYNIFIKNYVFVLYFSFTFYLFIFIINYIYSFLFYSFSNLILFINYNIILSNIYIFPFIFIFIFITFLSILFCLVYNKNEVNLFFLYCLFIVFIGINLFFFDSIVFFFIMYEMLLLPSFFILYKFAKTRRAIEAAYLMFFWTQFGAMFLIFSFIYLFFLVNSSNFINLFLFSFSQFDINFCFFLWFIGFGVKFPIWPFYGWLPKAHVEASTNFSIFLSGVLVKFAFFAFLKCSLFLILEPSFILIYPILIIGILDSSFKLFYQIDLKKIVAYSTVIEMHWLTICVISGYSYLFLAAFCMLISHAFLSTNFFFLVDAISRRFKSRLITEITSISLITPKLFLITLVNLLIFLGFPGSIFFISEFLFFSFLFDLMPNVSILLLIILYLIVPTIFFKAWLSSLFGLSKFLNNKVKLDLDSKEILLYYSIVFILFWLGLSWQVFLF